MILGFTGTRDGMSPKQLRWIVAWLEHKLIHHLHHGDCLGADVQMHYLAQIHRIPITRHPGNSPRWSANCAGAIDVRPRMSPLARNHNIIIASHELLAIPGTYEEVLRSGTWATIRDARRMRRVIHIVLPDGTYIEETPT